jgi:hypothetical protein
VLSGGEVSRFRSWLTFSKEIENMPQGPDKYESMTALYADPKNVEGKTYGKRWLRHEWIQIVEEQVTDNIETQTIVMAVHGGGIEAGTSEIALLRPVTIRLH